MNELSSWSSDHSDAALPLLEHHPMASRPGSLPAGALGSRSILLQNGCRPSFALHQINEHIFLNEFFNTKELLRVVSFPTNPGSMMSVKFLIALRWKHYLLSRSPPKAASQRNFPSDFKWQKLALSAPLKPRKVAMHPRFTTPERLTPSYALVGGRGGEKILRY